MRYEAAQRSPRRQGSRYTSEGKNFHIPSREERYDEDSSRISPSDASDPRVTLGFHESGNRRPRQNHSYRQRENHTRRAQSDSAASGDESIVETSRGPIWSLSPRQRRDVDHTAREPDNLYFQDQDTNEPSFDHGSGDRSPDMHDYLLESKREARSRRLSPRNPRMDSTEASSRYGDRDEAPSSVGSDSRSHSSSYETGSSYTTSSSEDDFALNANCMNTFFNKASPASHMIQCTKGGASGEVQLKMTLPLPHHLMKGLEDFVPTKKEIQTAMQHIRVNGDKFAKKCNFDYSNQLFDEQVMDDDFADRIRPEFFKSLFESPTEGTSTVGEELGHESLMPPGAMREAESAFSPDPNRPRQGRIPRIESNNGALGIPRPDSLPSHIELSGNSSYMSSQDSYGLISKDGKRQPESQGSPTKRGGGGGFIHSKARDPIQNRVSDQLPLRTSRFDLSAKKPRIPDFDFDETNGNPSFDEGRVSSPKINMNREGQRRLSQSDKYTHAKPTSPSKKQSMDWIPARRQHLELVTLQESTANPEGIPSSVGWELETTERELKAVCSDLTVDEETFVKGEFKSKGNFSKSRLNADADLPSKLFAYSPKKKPTDFSLTTFSRKTDRNENRENDFSPYQVFDEVMGPADEINDSARRSCDSMDDVDELISPMDSRKVFEAVLEDENRNSDLAKLALTGSAEEVPMDELMSRSMSQHRPAPESDVGLENDDMGDGVDFRWRLEREECSPSAKPNRNFDEFQSTGTFFDDVTETRSSAAPCRQSSTLVSSEGKCADVVTDPITVTSKSSDAREREQTVVEATPRFETPMDEPGRMTPPSTNNPETSSSAEKTSDSQSESAHSMAHGDLGRPSAKSVSSTSNAKSQVTLPTNNKTHEKMDEPSLLISSTHDKMDEPSLPISSSTVGELPSVDFAIRMKDAAATRLESMNERGVIVQAPISSGSFEPPSPSDPSGSLASKLDTCPNDNLDDAVELPASSSEFIIVTSLPLNNEDYGEIHENEAVALAEIDVRSQAVEINYIGDVANRHHDSQSLATEPALFIAPSSTTYDASQTVTTMETPLRAPPNGTFDTYDRSAWSSAGGSHFKKSGQRSNTFYNFDEDDEDSDDEEEYQFDERFAKLSSLLPASSLNKKPSIHVVKFSVESFFSNMFYTLWILVCVWTKQVLGLKRSRKCDLPEGVNTEPNFSGMELSGDIQPTIIMKIQGGHRSIRSECNVENDEAGTDVHYVIPDIHTSADNDSKRQIWMVNSSSRSARSGSWQSPKLAETYSSIRHSFSRSDAKSVASMKDWTAAPSPRYSGFVEE